MATEEKSLDLSDREEWDDLPFLEKVEALRQTVTVPEVAQLAGLETDHRNKIRSPWNPDERTPSCHLYDDHFWDYSTGKGGDIFDLMMALNPDQYDTLAKAVWAIYQRAVQVGKQYGDVELAEPRELQDFAERLPATQFVDDGLFCRAEYGCRVEGGDVLVPHRDEDGVYAVKVRFGRGGKGSWAGSQFTHRLYDPFGWSGSYIPKQTVVICEGESDVWALKHVLPGCDVYGLPGGAGTWRDHWLEDLGCYNRVLVCMDNDRAGAEARDKLLRKCGWGRSERLDVPQLYNDAREAVVAGWRPQI
jgi:hypothetical protein